MASQTADTVLMAAKELKRDHGTSEAAAEWLLNAFQWYDSKMGQRYWESVHQLLLEDAEHDALNVACPHCGSEI